MTFNLRSHPLFRTRVLPPARHAAPARTDDPHRVYRAASPVTLLQPRFGRLWWLRSRGGAVQVGDHGPRHPRVLPPHHERVRDVVLEALAARGERRQQVADPEEET